MNYNNMSGDWTDKTQFLSFNDENDDDFDYIFRSRAKKDCISREKEKGASGGQARKTCRLEKRGDNVDSDVNAPTDKKACTQFYMDRGMSKRSAIVKCKLSTKFGVTSGNAMETAMIEDGEVMELDESGNPTVQKAGIGGALGGKKGLLIVGGVLVVGMIGFLALRPRN